MKTTSQERQRWRLQLSRVARMRDTTMQVDARDMLRLIEDVDQLKNDMAWILNLCATENPKEYDHTLHVDIKTVAENALNPTEGETA